MPSYNFVAEIVMPDIEPPVSPRSTPVSASCKAVAPALAPEVTVEAATLLTVPVKFPPNISEVLSWFAVAPEAAPLATVLAAVPPIVTPLAIEPDVAVIAPDIVAEVAVTAPEGLTLNSALANVSLPR